MTRSDWQLQGTKWRVRSPEMGRNQGREGGGWTPSQAASKDLSPGWGLRGPPWTKETHPPILEDKPSAQLRRPRRSHPPPPDHPTQRTMVTLTFAPPQPQKVPLFWVLSTPPGPHHLVMFSFLSLFKGPSIMVKMLHFRARHPSGLNPNSVAHYLSGLQKFV